MADKTYNYTIATDIVSGMCDARRLHEELVSSEITRALRGVNIDGPDVDIIFIGDADLSVDDKTLLDGDTVGPAGGIVGAHSGVPATGPEVVFTQLQPQTFDPLGEAYQQCDRDFKITPGKFIEAGAVEDLLINVLTNQEEPWVGEFTLVGVYKSDGVACADQADCDANGVMSIFEYRAVNQSDGTTQICYNIKSGMLSPDPNIPDGERLLHRVYTIAAALAGQANYVRLFDGYIGAIASLETVSPTAKLLGLSAPGISNVLRFYFIHPATAGVFRSHVLRLITYRPGGTF